MTLCRKVGAMRFRKSDDERSRELCAEWYDYIDTLQSWMVRRVEVSPDDGCPPPDNYPGSKTPKTKTANLRRVRENENLRRFWESQPDGLRMASTTGSAWQPPLEAGRCWRGYRKEYEDVDRGFRELNKARLFLSLLCDRPGSEHPESVRFAVMVSRRLEDFAS